MLQPENKHESVGFLKRRLPRIIESLPPLRGIFNTRGPVPPTSPLYVERVMDTAVNQLVARREFISLIGPRGSGKTSLLFRLKHLLGQDEAYVPVYVNLDLTPKHDSAAWFGHVFQQIMRQLPPRDALGFTAVPSNGLEFYDAVASLLTLKLHERVLVILFDEVGSLPGPLRTDFASALRELYVNRTLDPVLKRFVCVLCGTFIPDQLIADPIVSPFRVTEVIFMQPASPSGVRQIGWQFEVNNMTLPEAAIERLNWWTNGDLYLTQRVCDLVLAQIDPANAVDVALIDHVVGELLAVSDVGIAAGIKNLDDNPAALRLLRAIVDGQSVQFTMLVNAVMDLWLAGLVVKGDDGLCEVSNRVYERALRLRFPRWLDNRHQSMN